MTGEIDLGTLLRALSPKLNSGRYVNTQIQTGVPAGANPVVVIPEDEGLTLILTQEQADELDLAYDFVAAWITLQNPLRTRGRGPDSGCEQSSHRRRDQRERRCGLHPRSRVRPL